MATQGETRASSGHELNNNDAFRIKADHILSQLEIDAEHHAGPHRSWVKGERLRPTIPTQQDGPQCRQSDNSKRSKSFDRNGFILVKNFVGEREVADMKEQMETLADTQWDPFKKTVAFRTDEKQIDTQGSDDYFLESASRVHYFAENDALNADGSLKDEYKSNKTGALNKAGHGMHMIPGAFQDYATSERVKSLVKDLGWTDPVIPQSMYIFKQPKIGGAVTSHQDSTFLYTTPRQTCLGLWLALDDATLENGCLWVRPKSHCEPVRRKFIRNPQHFGLGVTGNVPQGDTSKPQMIFETLDNSSNDIPWEGKLPSPDFEGLFDAGFVPVECSRGDLLAFVGELDHLSLPNTSPYQRHTFQLHLVEGPNAGVEWTNSNWLQYPNATQFLSIK